MRKVVWIFGDSYADNTYIVNDKLSAWPILLDQKYIVHNFAKAGSGPDYAIQQLVDNIDLTPIHELNNISVIFLISDIYRFNMKFFKEASDQYLFKYINDESSTNPCKQEIKPYKSYNSFISKFFDMYVLNSTYQKTELLKIMSLLKTYSDLFEKMLVWSVFQSHSIYPTNTEKYIILPYTLFSVDRMPYDVDHRNNHLNEPNHIIMFDQLSNWIDYNIPVNFNKFIIRPTH